VRWRWLIVVPLLTAAACGGGGSASSSDGTAAARIPATIAASLATQADAVAAQLDAGNGCAARGSADRLQSAVDLAVATNRIPVRLQAPLESAVASLSSRIVCAPHPPRPHPPGHDHHKKRGKHGEGD